jgi:hypothetical protein
VLVCAAALLLLLTSIAAYAVTLPAMIVVVAAAVLTARRLTAEDSRALWPAAAFIPVVVLLWLVAGALALDGVNDSCASTASQLGGPSVDCGELGAPEGAAILALVAAPAAFVAYLWRRSPQPTAEL